MSDSLLQQLIDDAGFGLIVLDQQGRVVVWNDWAAEKSSIAQAEATGRRITTLFPELAGSRLQRAIVACLKDGTSERLTYRLHPALFPIMVFDNGHKELMKQIVSLSPVDLSDGKTGCYIQITDKTEAVKRESILRQAQIDAEKADQTKTEFLATMSHEIRTPLNGVLGMAELLKSTPLDQEQKSYVQLMIRSGHSLVKLVNDILDLSKLEVDKVELDLAPMSVPTVIQEVLDLFEGVRLNTPVDVVVNIASDIPHMILGDASRFRQMLFNLVGNAFKFTHHGQIKICAELEYGSGDAALLCRVEDTGVGIDEEIQASIFDRYSYADASPLRKKGSAGLGLAICHEIAGLFGGRLTLDSTLGTGSVFSFTMPFGLPEEGVVQAREVSADEPPIMPSREKHILVAEDNGVNQLLLQTLLSKAGFKVTLVGNGQEAVDLVKKSGKDIDLIFMDISMPVMDGMEATSIIRHMKGGVRNIPIIALTAHALPEDEQRFLESGVNDCLTKPFKPADLFAKINTVFTMQEKPAALLH